MTFLKRVFSSDYRRALAAEATGDYTAAARAYALAGEPLKVAEMHLLLAERAGRGEPRLGELRTALQWTATATAVALEQRNALRQRIVEAMARETLTGGVITDSDRARARETAELFVSVGQHVRAGECFELAGDEQRAALAYQQAGEVERLEFLLGREEEQRRKEAAQRNAMADYEMALAGGARDRAVEALRRVIALKPEPQVRRLLEALQSRLITNARVRLRSGDMASVYVGGFPLVLGREPGCHFLLRDPGISRRHAELFGGETGFGVRDLQSSNGTLVGGLRLAAGGELSLVGECELGLGEFCRLRCRAHPDMHFIEVEVLSGLDRGLTLLAGTGALPVSGGAAELQFVAGRPILAARTAPRMTLNAMAVSKSVQLLVGDRITLGDGRHETELEVQP